MLANPLRVRAFLSIAAGFLLTGSAASAQTTSFTYQGKVTQSGAAANGTYDLEFKLIDAAGAPIGAPLVREDVVLRNGVFTVQLDFGATPFSGADRSLEIGVRPGASTNAFTTVTPRQPLGSVAYAIRALTAGTADTATTANNATNATTATNAQQLGGVAASQYVQTSDPRLNDARPPTAASDFYIQNQNATPQTATFNITGNGTVGGILRVVGLGAPGATALCRNASNEISTCSGGGGIGAESESQMARQQEQITQQKAQIESLKKLVCADHPDADVCR